jgi:hypothetical protein
MWAKKAGYLFGRELLAVDGTRIKAVNNNLQPPSFPSALDVRLHSSKTLRVPASLSHHAPSSTLA